MFAGELEELEFLTEEASLLNNAFCSRFFITFLRIAAPSALAMGFFFFGFEPEPEMILVKLSLLTSLCLLTSLHLLFLLALLRLLFSLLLP